VRGAMFITGILADKLFSWSFSGFAARHCNKGRMKPEERRKGKLKRCWEMDLEIMQ